MSGILLIGGGGHCRAVIDVLEKCNVPIAGIIHGPNCAMDAVLNYPPLGRDVDLPELYMQHSKAIVTLGQIKTPKIRQNLFNLLTRLNYELPSVISPLAYFSKHAKLGHGSIVMHNALINAGVRIGDNCIINTKALIEHDCSIASHCHIAIGATLCGAVKIDEGSFVGAGAIIKQDISIGRNCIIGMGCIVKRNMADGETYV